MSAPEGVPSGNPAESFRPLPPRPNLEFERKEAKKLRRRARLGDAVALERFRAAGLNREEPSAIQLADAQLTLAREYGFASWPKLVAYFTSWERHALTPRSYGTHGPDFCRGLVAAVMSAHARGSNYYLSFLATYIPRLFGKPDNEILATQITEHEAQLAVARMRCFTSWDALMEAVAREPASHEQFGHGLFGDARAAIMKGDYELAQDVVEAHSELLQVAFEGVQGSTLLGCALLNERHGGTREARQFSEWLVSRGADLQHALNRLLIEGPPTKATTDLVFALERGVDPNWAPPNGITILEHMLLRWWNPEAVDILLKYVTPRPAFWIAAGVGDVAAMRKYFDRDGRLTEAARRDRPDFTAVGLMMPNRPEVEDRDIMFEAFTVAGSNHRFAAMDLLVERGLPIDYSPWITNLLHLAVGNRWVPVVEHLVRRGANLDLKGRHPDATARELAVEAFRERPEDPAVRRIHELCNE